MSRSSKKPTGIALSQICVKFLHLIIWYELKCIYAYRWCIWLYCRSGKIPYCFTFMPIKKENSEAWFSGGHAVVGIGDYQKRLLCTKQAHTCVSIWLSETL